jgi:hypothetical protein
MLDISAFTRHRFSLGNVKLDRDGQRDPWTFSPAIRSMILPWFATNFLGSGEKSLANGRDYLDRKGRQAHSWISKSWCARRSRGQCSQAPFVINYGSIVKMGCGCVENGQKPRVSPLIQSERGRSVFDYWKCRSAWPLQIIITTVRTMTTRMEKRRWKTQKVNK